MNSIPILQVVQHRNYPHQGAFLLSTQGMCGILDARKEAGELKILFVNLPYHGHVIPTIGLTQELIKAGHQVTYLMPYDWEDKIADSSAEFLGYENNTGRPHLF